MNPDYHLVLRVYKLLTGEADKAIEPYFNATKVCAGMCGVWLFMCLFEVMRLYQYAI